MAQKFLHLTWDDVQSLTEEVAAKIIEARFKPDIIIAVSRGGFDPGRILCDQLSVRRLACVQVESYMGINKSREPMVVIPVNADVQGKKVLVSDDVSDTGSSLKKAKDHMLEMGAELVKVATLHIKPWSKFMPDFFARSTDAWVVYPWEVKECMMEVVSNLLSQGERRDSIEKKLIELGFKVEAISKYFSFKDV